MKRWALFLLMVLQTEAHASAVIREIYANPLSTRAEIWEAVHGNFPADNSAEADLFKLLISDLSLGRVIRQQREVNHAGQFVRKPPAVRGRRSSPVLKSPFEEKERYELTELGKQFVHYVLSDVVPRMSG